MRRAAMLTSAVFALALGAFAALGDDQKPREVKLSLSETITLQELSRRAEQHEQAKKTLEASMKKLSEDIATVHSELRTAHGLTERDVFVGADVEKRLLFVKSETAPTGTR